VVFPTLDSKLSTNRWFVITAKHSRHPTVKKAVNKGPEVCRQPNQRLPDLA
jgi:hypothetical protein